VTFEELGFIEDWAQVEGHTLSATKFYRGDALPDRDDFDLLVVMGGPMGAGDDDTYPWLTTEKLFIKRAVDEEKSVLGICLGAQLLAAALGARVYRNPHKEIGWFPVSMTEKARKAPHFALLPSQLTVFHWHGDTFDLPREAIRVAEGEACVNQAFMCSPKVIGLQFHLEMKLADVTALLRHCPEDLAEGPYVQSPAEMLADGERFAVANAALHYILDHLCD
jgi:GMP synthase (glutamine-hydrolysing)